MDAEPERDTHRTMSRPSFREAFRFWLKLGFISFGGPSGQIAIMHTELVERKKWITEQRFLHALNYCMLLPGPEAQQLATYCGWLLHRTLGGLVAGALFVIPSVFVLWLLSFIYAAYGNVPAVESIFHGLKPAVLAIVVSAVLRIGGRALKNGVMWGLAAVSFIAIFFLDVPFPAIVIGAAAVGFLGGARWPHVFGVHERETGEENRAFSRSIRSSDSDHDGGKPTWKRAARILAIGLVIWWTPVAVCGLWLDWDHFTVQEGIFFSKAALVTFGGAYAVLPYVAQRAVEDYGWLEPGQMMDGLGLAETTPGPLIMVVQFVGFMGGWQHPGSLPPLLAASLGAFITTWVTFVPCFLWIFLGAPHIEQLRGNRKLTCALSTVTAAVVGVILNLAVWFGIHVLWPGEPAGLDLFALLLSLCALLVLQIWKVEMYWIIIGAAMVGWIHGILG